MSYILSVVVVGQQCVQEVKTSHGRCFQAENRNLKANKSGWVVVVVVCVGSFSCGVNNTSDAENKNYKCRCIKKMKAIETSYIDNSQTYKKRNDIKTGNTCLVS